MGLLDFFTSTISKGKFAKLCVAEICRQGFTKEMTFDEAEFRFYVDHDTSQIFNLHNAYRDYTNAEKSQRADVLYRYAAGLQAPDIPSNFEEAKSYILPIIRSKGLAEHLRLSNLIQGGNSEVNQLLLTFSADANLMLAYDTEHSIQTVGQTDIANWGVPLSDALDAAMNNLRDKAVAEFEDLGDGVRLGQWNDAYDSSRILLSDLIHHADVGEKPVMLVPTRGCLLVAASNNVEGQLKIIRFARENAKEHGRAVSALMYQFVENELVAYRSDDQRVLQEMANLNCEYLADFYSSQKEFLDKLYDKERKDIFVATYGVAKKTDTGNLISFCSWTKDVDSILPKTDVVAVVELDASMKHTIKYIAWDDAISFENGLIVDLEFYPPRYRVAQFLSSEALSAIEEVSL